MLQEKSTRAKIGIIAVATALIGFLVGLFAPTIMTETLYFSKNNIVLLSAPTNLRRSLISIGFIVVILMLLAFKHTKWMYAAASLSIIGVISFWAWTLTNYTAIQTTQVISKSYMNEYVLPWEQMEQVVYEYQEDLPYGQYTFKTATDELVVMETRKFGIEERQNIYRVARSFDVEFIEREIVK